MRWLSQVAALTAFNLRTMPQRWGSIVASLVGVAGVVAVMVGVLSIARGFARTLETTGRPDTAMILRAGSDSEMTSYLLRDEIRVIEESPIIARRGETPLTSPELFVVVNLPKRTTGTDANVPLRGVEPAAFLVHEDLEIVEGRTFRPGTNEVIVGRGAQQEFVGLEVGETVELGQSRWQVVGAFTADGGLSESEMWADAATIQQAYRRGSSYQIVKARMASAGSFQQLADSLTTDPRLEVKVERETDYYAAQSRTLTLLVTGLGTLIAGLMGLGAIFGALNTMYTAVAARAREIATLKALGFGGGPVVLSVLVESLLVAAAGGSLGALAAWLVFDGYRTATLNWQSFSQVAFAFEVDGPLLVQGIVYSLLIGLVGGLLPAIRAARMPVALALREG